MEEWIDPQRQWVRSLLVSGSQRSHQLLRNGQEYDIESGTAVWVLPASQLLLHDVARMCGQLRQGGFRAVYAPLLIHATGPIMRVSFAGRPALRFNTGDPSASSFSTTPTTIWLDAQTRVELQNQTSYRDGTVFTTRVMRAARLDPGTLPPDFFDPPNSPSPLWDQVTGWVRAQIDGLRHT
jgi:hypothetical protein